MMEDQTRNILARIARGELSPDEGARLLEEMRGAAPQTVAVAPPARRVRVVRGSGTAEITGDSQVDDVVVDGAQRVWREGDTSVVEGVAASGSSDVRELRVRMNPHLPLEVTGRAGSVHIRGVHAPVRCDAHAGSTFIDGFTEPFEVSFRAGSMRASGRLGGGGVGGPGLGGGHSRVSCEAGSIKVHLERGSSVRVWAHGSGGTSMRGVSPGSPLVVGGGEATLELHAARGSIDVSTEE